MRGASLSLAAVALGCRPSLPTAPLVTSPLIALADQVLVDVPVPPPPAHEEFIPPQPGEDAVWVDGQWFWDGRWRWEHGAWVLPPPGAAFSPWRTFRRTDGTLVFAGASWRDAHGNRIPNPRVLASAWPGHTAEEPETQPIAPAGGR